MIAAIGRNRELGKGNDLLWKIPADLKRFKELTTGHPVIMGRKTYESIVASLGHALPNRLNIAVSRTISSGAFEERDTKFVQSVEDALVEAKKQATGEIFIIGGGQIYTAALPFAEMLQLTLIDAEADADSFFPAYEHLFTKKVFEEQHEWKGLTYTWVDLEK
jgi:dihydrofolate reductase